MPFNFSTIFPKSLMLLPSYISEEDSRWSKYGDDDAEGRAAEIPQDLDCLGILFLILLFVSYAALFFSYS